MVLHFILKPRLTHLQIVMATHCKLVTAQNRCQVAANGVQQLSSHEMHRGDEGESDTNRLPSLSTKVIIVCKSCASGVNSPATQPVAMTSFDILKVGAEGYSAPENNGDL